MDSIDLGRSGGGIPLAPNPEKHYPSLYIDLDSDAVAEIPDCGTMEVYFRVTSRNVTEREGKKTASVSLEIQKITDIEEDEEDETPERKKTEDTLDKYAEEESKK